MNVRIFWVHAMECMCAQTRPQFILSSEAVLGGMELEPMLTPREKSPLPENVPWGGSNPWHCGQRAQALPTEQMIKWSVFIMTVPDLSINRPPHATCLCAHEGQGHSKWYQTVKSIGNRTKFDKYLPFLFFFFYFTVALKWDSLPWTTVG